MPQPLQDGIYYQSGVRPGYFFAIVFLGMREGAKALQVQSDLVSLHQLYGGLKSGISPELPNNRFPPGNLTCLFGYGPNLFQLNGTIKMPPELVPKHRFLSPYSGGGGPLLIGSGLSYAPDVNRNIATEAVAIQFVADTQLAVNRAVVETSMLLQDGTRDLRFEGFFGGFSREDGRSWLGFHDGISNMRSGLERENAIRIKNGPSVDGSTLCFMRLEVDVSAWRQLSSAQQEMLVGRQKASGCPFSHLDAGGAPAADGACPVPSTGEVTDPGNENFRMPPSVSPDAIPLRQSHVQRANLAHRTDTDVVQSLRIFRQGYEFLESVQGPRGFLAGLNFVSFQDSPARVISLLTRQDWLGQTNFGGDPDIR